MAGWITAFRAIPWSELIAAAPVVARGTRKLWETVRHREAGPAATPDADSRLQSLEAQVEELRTELTAASGLMATVAEQNEQLIHALSIMQGRTRALLIATALLAAAVIALLVNLLLR